MSKIFGPKTEKITGRWITCDIVLFNRVLLSNRGWDGEACGTLTGELHRISAGKPKGKGLLGRPRCKDIKIYLIKTGRDDLN